jgi:hypothetical protein
MLVGKNPNFKGPKTHWGILKQIRLDLRERQIYVSLKMVQKIVLLFFNTVGISMYFKQYRIQWTIRNIGRFTANSKRRSELWHFHRERNARRRAWWRKARNKYVEKNRLSQ